MSCLSLHLLGPSLVTQAEGTTVDLKYDKVLALLSFLAGEAERAHRRDALAGLLWPELPQKAARNNLRQGLLTLRGAIGDREASPPYFLSNRLTIQFNQQSLYWLDVEEFVAAVHASEQHAHRSATSCQVCARQLERAVMLYRGTFLAEFALPDSTAFEEWALIKREWLNGLMLRALERLAIFHERRGNLEKAVVYGQRQLELEPWREEAQRHLMRLYLLQGNTTAALAQYESCRALLAQELSVEPEEETTRLYRYIRDMLDGKPLFRKAFVAERPYRVPHPPTPFIGRERELEEIGRLVDSADCRLLTLVGPGGVGKTRLALQAAADQAGLFADGIFYLDLAVQTAELLPEAIADCLDLDLSKATDTQVAIRQYLSDKEILLVLDNFEHLFHRAGLLEQLLRHAPMLMLLVASRERLNLQGERIFPVQGFAVEWDQAELATEQVVAENAAIQLFIQGAQRAQGDFTLTSQNMTSVIRICQLVHGLPLGIELAAAWTRVLSCAEIAVEIERSLHFLTSPIRDLPPRHRSIAAVFDHSWALLTTAEKETLAKLSVFYGTFSRPAGEQVAGGTLPLLASLVDKSLLQRHPFGRYGLHPLLRQYVAERLQAAGDEQSARNRHLAYFLELAEQAEAEFHSADQVAWLEWLATEQDNLRTALSWALESRAAEQGLRLAVALYRYWYWRSHFREGVHWLEAFLAMKSSLPIALHTQALYAVGVLTAEQNDYQSAERYLEESLTLRRELADVQGQAACLNSLGIVAWSQQAYKRARALLEESLVLRRELGETNLGPVLNSLGLVALAEGAYGQAELYFAEQLQETRQRKHDMGTAIGLSNLGAAVLEQGRVTEACAHFRESLALFQNLADREGIAWCLEGLAAVAIREENAACAVTLCAAASTLREQIHAPLTPAERPRFERTVTEARAILGPQGFATVWAHGQQMSLETIVARAVTSCSPDNSNFHDLFPPGASLRR